MKIGMDIQSTVGVYSGLGVYTRNLLLSLAPGHDVAKPLCRQADQFQFFATQPRRPWNTLDRLWWENQTLPQSALIFGIN